MLLYKHAQRSHVQDAPAQLAALLTEPGSTTKLMDLLVAEVCATANVRQETGGVPVAAVNVNVQEFVFSSDEEAVDNDAGDNLHTR